MLKSKQKSRLNELCHWAAKKASCIKNEAGRLEDAVEIESRAEGLQTWINALSREDKKEHKQIVSIIQKNVYELSELINTYNSSHQEGISIDQLYKLIHRTARMSEALGYKDVGTTNY